MEIITIDGLSGVGKTARAIALSKKLGYKFISFGYIFRAISYAELKGINFDKDHFEFKWDMNSLENPLRVICQSQDITSILHGTPEIDEKCYEISKKAGIERLAIETLQRLKTNGSFVIEGRNTNTLFSKIEISYYLFCSEEERSKRIALELEIKGRSRQQSEEVLHLANKRDTVDQMLMAGFTGEENRLVYIDSTLFTPEDTLNEMLRYREYFRGEKKVSLILLCLEGGAESLYQWAECLGNHGCIISRIIPSDSGEIQFRSQAARIGYLDYNCIPEITDDTEHSIVVVLKAAQEHSPSQLYENYIRPHLFGNNLLIGSSERDLLKLLSQECSTVEASFSFRTTFFRHLAVKSQIIKHLKVININE
ncbi:(d)CMP kinase [Paenibacillus sp. S150]|uniref:(d)CMP kinase n=1 Tax=Paenibacillus sp. S150 TaxID=2749826 RepID=UPI001C58E213|nr:(d)CMP kinase [Paenibacillus sp. S150]MBW4085035.1 (d)CMP kinase [Paenibacillus sp. S150]